ncbi:MAG: PIN domain-containing protein [Chloroflexota bacterium]
MNGIVDTTVIIHLFRKQQRAVNWLKTQQTLGITSITWMEMIQGANSKAHLASSKALLSQFQVIRLDSNDQTWAMQQLETFQFSHHIGINDCLIASVAYRLQIPLYTHNLKHLQPLLGSLAQKPY